MRQRLKSFDRLIPPLLKRLYAEVKDDDLSGAAAELAYRFFLALFPFFIFLAALGGFIADLLNVANPTEEIMSSLGRSLPPDAASILRKQLDTVISSRDVGLLSIGILGAIWAASSGIGSVMKSLNRVYNVRETRPYLKRVLLVVGLTALAGGTLIGAFILLILGQVYGLELADKIGIGGIAAAFFTWGRWPVVFLVVMTAASFLYWAAPNMHLPFHWISPGALLFAAGWLVMSYLFGLYVTNFGSYNVTYGTLGGVVAMLVWFYFTGLILLTGAELNLILAREAMPETERAKLRAENPQAVTALARPGAPGSAPVDTTQTGGSKPQKVNGPLAVLMSLAIAALALAPFLRRPAKKRAHAPHA